MTAHEFTGAVGDWLAIARKDWGRIFIMLGKEDLEAAAVFLEQSLEKYLKAFLLSRGWTLRKLHELDTLLDDAVAHRSGLENFRNLCERVSGYYLADRYPPLSPLGIFRGDLEKDLMEARQFIIALFPEEHLRP